MTLRGVPHVWELCVCTTSLQIVLMGSQNAEKDAHLPLDIGIPNHLLTKQKVH